jgi:hypothetical protein
LTRRLWAVEVAPSGAAPASRIRGARAHSRPIDRARLPGDQRHRAGQFAVKYMPVATAAAYQYADSHIFTR